MITIGVDVYKRNCTGAEQEESGQLRMLPSKISCIDVRTSCRVPAGPISNQGSNTLRSQRSAYLQLHRPA